jgi:hypothetical protein
MKIIGPWTGGIRRATAADRAARTAGSRPLIVRRRWQVASHWRWSRSAAQAVSGTPPAGTTSFSYSVTATNTAGTATAGPFTVTVGKPSSNTDISVALSCPASQTVGGTGTCTPDRGQPRPPAASKVIAAIALPAALSQVLCSSGCTRLANVDAWTLASLASGAPTLLTRRCGTGETQWRAGDGRAASRAGQRDAALRRRRGRRVSFVS